MELIVRFILVGSYSRKKSDVRRNGETIMDAGSYLRILWNGEVRRPI